MRTTIFLPTYRWSFFFFLSHLLMIKCLSDILYMPLLSDNVREWIPSISQNIYLYDINSGYCISASPWQWRRKPALLFDAIYIESSQCPPIETYNHRLSVQDFPVYKYWGRRADSMTLEIEGETIRRTRKKFLSMSRFKHKRRHITTTQKLTTYRTHVKKSRKWTLRVTKIQILVGIPGLLSS